MIDNLYSPFAFVVDTDEYSGSFERQMCAYITGETGECGVGGEHAEMFKKEVQGCSFLNINQEADINGTRRPCTIYATPGFFNDGFGNHYQENTDQEIVIEKYRKDRIQYYQDILDRKRLIDISCSPQEWQNSMGKVIGSIPAWTEKTKKVAIQQAEKDVEDAKIAMPGHCPAYQSVAILFYKKPTAEQVVLMKERAYKFAYAISRKPMNILSFRLVQNTQQTIKEYI